MCRCCMGTQPPKRTLWARITEWLFGNPEANEKRAIKYLRDQLCSLTAHNPGPGPAPNVEKCQWCGTLMHAREKDLILEFREQIRKGWAEKIDESITEESAFAPKMAGKHFEFIYADEPPSKLHIRKPKPGYPIGHGPLVHGPAQTIRAMRGWKMSSDEADRILRELVKRAPQDWAAGGPPIVVPWKKNIAAEPVTTNRKKKSRRGR